MSAGLPPESTEELSDLGITWTDTGMQVTRPAWCDTDEKWSEYREAVALAWREAIDEAVIEIRARETQ